MVDGGRRRGCVGVVFVFGVEGREKEVGGGSGFLSVPACAVLCCQSARSGPCTCGGSDGSNSDTGKAQVRAGTLTEGRSNHS